jgi:ribosomal protein S12 methylthiotransferase
MYAYPGHISPKLIDVMASDPRICHYLDLPLQHAHPDTLKRMKRPSNIDRTRQTIADLRAAMPDLALRTSFIVGFPGETEAEFEALLQFVSETRFDRVGAFLYSQEQDTAAARLPNAVPDQIKRERLKRLMSLQQQISLESNQAQIGRQLEVLIEGQGDGLSIGRTYRDAPEIDGLVLIPADIEGGQLVKVKINGAMEYDLTGEPLSQK